jgi:hypothetical protein
MTVLAPFAVAYLVGMLLGELMLLGWWGMQQTVLVTPVDYLRKKWATALFSGAFALCGCVLWAEGSLVGMVNEKYALTMGYSLVSGGLITFFAHSLIWVVGRVWGLKPPGVVGE